MLLTVNVQMMNGAEQGGEGGSDNLRTDFEDTALFIRVRTGSDGIAEGSFILPDNITSWRVTMTAFSKDAQTGIARKNIPSGLSFFADVMVEDVYLSGDDIHIKTKTAGDPTFIGEKVSVRAKVTDSGGTVIKEKALSADFGEAVFIELGNSVSAIISSLWKLPRRQAHISTGADSISRFPNILPPIRPRSANR